MRRSSALLVFVLLLGLPFADALVAIPFAKRIDAEVGGVHIFKTVEAPGFLWIEDPRDSDSLPSPVSYLEGTNRYEYVEIQVDRRVFVPPQFAEPPSPASSTVDTTVPTEWFAQLRTATDLPGEGDCSAEPDIASGLIYDNITGKCFSVTRTWRPVSTYAYSVFEFRQSVGRMGDVLNVRADCAYVREITTRKVLARQCRVFYHTWLTRLFGFGAAFLGPFWESPLVKKHLDVSDVIVNPLRNNKD